MSPKTQAAASHCEVCPALQATQVPQESRCMVPTRSPTFHAVVPSPTAMMRPTVSWPGVTGSATKGKRPDRSMRSRKQTPQASTLISTLPAPGSAGGSNASTRSGVSNPSASILTRFPIAHSLAWNRPPTYDLGSGGATQNGRPFSPVAARCGQD